MEFLMSLSKRLAVALVASLAATGCSGGGSSVFGPTNSKGSGSGSGAAQQSVTVKIHIPGASTVAALRSRHAGRRLFVSPATSFATVTTYQTTGGLANSTPFAAVTSDISTDKASTCTYDDGSNASTTGPRTCTISINAPAGLDYFTFQTFSADPTKTSYTSSIQLARASEFYTIKQSATNTLSAVLEGIVSTYSFVPQTYPSFDEAVSATETYTIAAYDASGYLIMTSDPAPPSTAGDEYANQLKITDTGFTLSRTATPPTPTPTPTALRTPTALPPIQLPPLPVTTMPPIPPPTSTPFAARTRSITAYAGANPTITVTDVNGNVTTPYVNYATDVITVTYTPGETNVADARTRGASGTSNRLASNRGLGSGTTGAGAGKAYLVPVPSPFFDTIMASSDTSGGDPAATVGTGFDQQTNQYLFYYGYLYPIALNQTADLENSGPGPTFTQGSGSASTLAFTEAGDVSQITPSEAYSETTDAPATFTATLSDSGTSGISGCGGAGLSQISGTNAFDITAGSMPTDSTCIATFTDQYGNSAVVDISSTITGSSVVIPPEAVFATLNQQPPGAFQIYEVDSPFNSPVTKPIAGGMFVNDENAPISGIAYDGSNVYFGSRGNIKTLAVNPQTGFAGETPTVTALPSSTTSGGYTEKIAPFVADMAYDPLNKVLVVTDQDGGLCFYATPLTATSTPLVCQSLPGGDQPGGVAIDGNSNYYFLDVTNPAVYTVHLSSTTHTVSATRSFSLGALPSGAVPVGIAVDKLSPTGIYVNAGGYFYRFDSSTAFAASPYPSAAATQQLGGCQTTSNASGGIAVFTGGAQSTLVVASCAQDMNPGTGYSGIGLQTYYPTGPSSYQENTNNGSMGVYGIGTDTSYPFWLSI
jgi:hypothetical protein